MPPRFTTEPESQTVIPKSSVLFKSVFEGTPPFVVKWFKDEMELIRGPMCLITVETYSSSVQLSSVGTLRSGIYSCQVSNEAGAIKSAAQLLVKGWTVLFFLSTTITVIMPLTLAFFSSPAQLLFLHCLFSSSSL